MDHHRTFFQGYIAHHAFQQAWRRSCAFRPAGDYRYAQGESMFPGIRPTRRYAPYPACPASGHN